MQADYIDTTTLLRNLNARSKVKLSTRLSENTASSRSNRLGSETASYLDSFRE
ncbi:hypothetical protein PIIN_11077 [Serendipita indica DSM 11827]|uniref:Uncharacterized protein n=1 Tax=Serendipita indica (strain DSM 11827) TaxID=1109443 RepID=G4U0J9_SERID|nr:hypothetical protein PIIN_11077 [Serendipita indica DSM 11827]